MEQRLDTVSSNNLDSSSLSVTRDHVGPNDIICSRNSEAIKHRGNQRYNFLIQKSREAYQTTDQRNDKIRITRQIIQEVKAYGGRFLRFDKHKQSYVEINDEAKREKVSHALRSAVDPKKKKRKSNMAFDPTNSATASCSSESRPSKRRPTADVVPLECVSSSPDVEDDDCSVEQMIQALAKDTMNDEGCPSITSSEGSDESSLFSDVDKFLSSSTASVSDDTSSDGSASASCDSQDLFHTTVSYTKAPPVCSFVQTVVPDTENLERIWFGDTVVNDVFQQWANEC